MQHEDKLDRLDEIADGAKWWFCHLNQLQNAVDNSIEAEMEIPLQKLENHMSSAVWVVGYMKYSMSRYCITESVVQEAKDDEAVLSIDYLTFLIEQCPDISADVREYIEGFNYDCRIYLMMRAFIDGDERAEAHMLDNLINPTDEQVECPLNVDLMGG